MPSERLSTRQALSASCQVRVRLKCDTHAVTATHPAIDCRNITKQYGDATALDQVSFVAEYGTVTGLLGSNGAGKTTLIRVLTTILSPTSGEFWVGGHSQNDPSAVKSSVGVLAESGGYPKRKRAFEHLVYHGRLYGLTLSESEDRSKELLGLVGLASRSTDRIGEFSRGMRQRLGIARAMVNHPTVLFLDEPTLGLDPAGQSEILELIERLAGERHVSVVLTSHLLDEIERSCDQIVILDRGRIVLDTPVQEAIAPSEGVGPALRLNGHPHQELLDVLTDFPVTYLVEPSGDIVVSLPPGTTPTEILTALMTAGVEIRRFDTRGRRLADAFHEMTRP